MPKALAKVQKQIAKKKKGATSSLHENSRDAKRLRRAGARSERLEKLAAATAKTYQPYVHRIEFFRNSTLSTQDPMSTEAMQALITQYIGRYSEEIQTLQDERRPGRLASTREGTLKQRTEAEAKEYASGFWIPEMSKTEDLERLSNWNGTWTGLNTLTFIRLSKDGTRHPSSFPPKGQS